MTARPITRLVTERHAGQSQRGFATGAFVTCAVGIGRGNDPRQSAMTMDAGLKMSAGTGRGGRTR